MSKSRLEKFLYALYSLDSSDLPIPQSRIEELYNCLVTGVETPTFKPLSRVEKYLMAILGAYDADSLPNPLNRVEVLLYKLATGDDNLDDIESFLSRHEELLGEIIRNGGINGDISFNDDYEYRRYSFATGQYTLENTAEQPVKSAILKGQTLVNLVVNSSVEKTVGKAHATEAKYDYIYQLENNKEYTLQFEISNFNATKSMSCSFDNGWNTADLIAIIDKNGAYKIKFTTKNLVATQIWFYWQIASWEDGNSATVKNIIILEGDYTNEDIPYFEGMQSVENPIVTTTGKNLFDISKCKPGRTIDENGNEVTISIPNYYAYGEFIPINNEFTMSITSNNGSVPDNTNGILLRFYDEDKNLVDSQWFSGSFKESNGRKYRTISMNGAKYLKMSINASGVYTDTTYEAMQTIQIEQGSTATSYEPFKPNILTVNEDVELRGIGEVKDELDLLTGELTQRIEEYTELSNQSCAISIYYQLDGHTTFTFGDWSNKIKPNVSSIFSNKLPYPTQNEGVIFDGWGIYLRIKNDKLTTLDSEGLKEWLIKEHFTIAFPMKTETVKTVDLSVVDQDGNDTELKTFDNSTHVTITSEGLVPESEIEVAKYIPYMTYELTEKETTLYNTKEHSVKSAVLKGNTIKKIGLESGSYNGYLDKITMDNRLRTSEPINGYNIIRVDCKDGYQAYIRSVGKDSSWNQSTSITLLDGPEKLFVVLFKKNDDSAFSQTDYGNIIEYTNIAEISDNNGNELVSVKNPVVTTSNEDDTKSTTVSSNEDVELHGVGEVKDELDCFTGEVTKRVGEVVFDGSEDWVQSGMGDPTIFYTSLNDMAHNNNYLNSISCDKFVTYIYEGSLNDSTSPNGITGYFDNTDTYPNENWLYIKCADSEGSVENLKQWLSQNPVTVHYELITESVETVDISVVDQYGNNTKLKSFDDITYVTLYSEGAIPEAELEVATKNEEVLATLSLRMDDIYAAQTTLEETSDIQSENVDATMFATTEIYEGLL